jgi:hypothetical protein
MHTYYILLHIVLYHTHRTCVKVQQKIDGHLPGAAKADPVGEKPRYHRVGGGNEVAGGGLMDRSTCAERRTSGDLAGVNKQAVGIGKLCPEH